MCFNLETSIATFTSALAPLIVFINYLLTNKYSSLFRN